MDWSFPQNPDVRAVHMILQPGDGSPHSRLLMWTGANATTFGGREWAWNPLNDTMVVIFPVQNFDSISVPGTDDDLFCAGHSMLGDGRLFVPGGTDPVTTLYGENKSRIFVRGSGTNSGTWTDPGEMEQFRWYPTSTTLRDGRVLVTSGLHHPIHKVFGGIRNESAPEAQGGDSLYRFAPIDQGRWDPPQLPALNPGSTRPSPREGHSFATCRLSGFRLDILFGGRDTSDTPQALDDLYFMRQVAPATGAENTYSWQKITLSGAPDPRAEHTGISVDTMLIVFGGVDDSGDEYSDAHRLYYNAIAQNFEWDALTPSGDPPSARYGHGAVYQHDHDSGLKRMIVYGGTTSGNDPSDTGIYELRLTGGGMAWAQLDTVDLGYGAPSPRARHAMVFDPAVRKFGAEDAHVALMYGGEIGSSSYSDTLWALWLFDDDTVGWQPVSVPTGDGAPNARARLSLTLDPLQRGRIYLFGGENGSGQPDGTVYSTVLFDSQSGTLDPEPWDHWADAGFTLSGHTTILDNESTYARQAEIYNPASGWDVLDNATLLQFTYPNTFVIPSNGTGGGRVLSFSINEKAHYLDIPASGATSGWQFHADLGFLPLGGVVYEPGRIMVAGSEHERPAIGTTKTLDASSMSNSWVTSASMQPRINANLVLLPNGTVLVVGGTTETTHGEGGAPPDSTLTERRPQIWDPEGNGGVGTWTPIDSLEQQNKHRAYHSTAVLLPDGRVVSAGGEYIGSKQFAEIYSPPYMFKPGSDDLAPRPEIEEAPGSINLGHPFTVCVADTSGITRAALLRPGATTHAFDQDQRYIPLGFVKKDGHLLVEAPENADAAPPGYYMLFLTGSKDGGGSYPDAPSIAHWVRINGAAGRDTCDAIEPIARKLYVDIVGSTSVGVTWEAPADDDSIAFSGTAKSYDIRSNSAPITSSNWSSSTQATGEPTPLDPGLYETAQVSGLSPCTAYYFALKSTDDNELISALGDTTSGKTWCGGGGGLAARRSPNLASAGQVADADRPLGRQAPDVSLRPVGGTLVVERRRVAEDRWEILVSRVASVAGLDPEEGPGIVLQNAEAAGWRTTGRFEAGLDDEVAVASLREASRVVFVGNWLLGAVAGAGRAASGSVVLTDASHSSEGDLKSTIVAGGAELLADDSLTLTYEAATETGLGQGWLLTVMRGGQGSASRRPGSVALPASFALHQNEPNPFGAATTIRFDLPRSTHVRLEVFDLLGRRVATLADAAYPAGFHSVQWGGRQRSGVGPGIYMYRIVAGEFSTQRKMVLLP